MEKPGECPGELGLVSETIKVIIVDDHTVAREGLRAMLETDPRVEVVGEAAGGLQALDLVAELKPNVVLMDVRMPGLDGLGATRWITLQHPGTAVVIMTSYDDEALVVDAVREGAAGYLLKDASRDLLSHTIAAVAEGGILIKATLLRKAIGGLTQLLAGASLTESQELEGLTEREQEVLRLVSQGRTNREIAEVLCVAEVTVKKHVQAVITKLRVTNRTKAAIAGVRLGFG